MSSEHANSAALAGAPTSRLGADRRGNRRVPVVLLGRFMRASRHEYPCKLMDMSVSGASMMSPVVVEPGEQIIAYFDNIGGIEGTVVRIFDGGFAIEMAASQHKREKIAAQLTYLINKHELQGTTDRRHERVKAANQKSTLKLDAGISVECRTIDVSLSGASIETTARPPIGTEVTFGKLRCRVMRHHEQGIGLAFLDIQEPEAIRKYFG
jgi:PilZ domain